MTRPSLKTILRLSLAATLLTATPVVSHAQGGNASATDAGRNSTPTAQSPEKKKEVEDENEAYRHSPMVQSFGRMLGMDAEKAATTFTWVNFLLVLAGLVARFLARALPKAFRDRNTAIQKHLVDARAATEEASARLNSVEDRLGKLDGQIAAMRAQSEKDSAADEQRIKASLEDETTKILAAAEQEIAAATLHAQREIQKYAAELAIEQAARKLSISAETDRLLVQNFARRLGVDESPEGHN